MQNFKILNRVLPSKTSFKKSMYVRIIEEGIRFFDYTSCFNLKIYKKSCPKSRGGYLQYKKSVV